MSLDSTLAKIGQLHSSLQIQVGEADGWYSFDDIWQTDLLDDLLARIADRYQLQDKHFLALSLLNQYSWMPLAGGIGAYYLDRRMLDLHPQNLLWHFDAQGSADGLRLRGSQFYGLPDSATPDMTILPDAATVRERLHADVQAHMQVILKVLRTKTGIGKPALWAVIEDRIGGLVLYAGKLADQLANCEQDVEAWSNVRQPVRRSPNRIIWIDHEAERHPFLMRSACCLSYKVPEYGYCSTCPLLPVAECEQRLRETFE